MLGLHNVRMKPSNVRKKVRELPNVRKELSRDVGTAQCEDGTIKFKEKSKGTTKCEKRIVTCDVGTAQCENGIVKCEKKSKGTTKCKKRTVTCDVGTTQCEDGTVKCEKKVRNHQM